MSLGDFEAFAKTKRPGKLASATLNAGQTSISLFYTDGKQQIVRPSTPGDTFDRPRLTRDGSTVGWTVYRLDGASYAYPEWLQFVRQGVRRRFACDGGMPQAWRFEGNHRVVVDCGFEHGAATGRRVLAAISTARILASVDLPANGSINPNAPPWALMAPSSD